MAVTIELNTIYEISGFEGDALLLERLSEMGFRREKKIKFVQKLPFHGPLIVEMDQTQISLREEEVECLQLKMS